MSTVLSDLMESLGNVPADRVRLQPLPGTATVADVVAIRAKEKRLCELVDGVLVEKAMGYWESILAVEIARRIGNFLETHPLGIVAGEAGMMQLFEGLVRIPDVSVVLRASLPDGKLPQDQVPLLAPDLAVEVLSPGNTEAEMERKRQEYFHAGTSLVWIIDPRKRTVAVYSSSSDVKVQGEGDVLDGGDVLPGLEIQLQELFAILD